MRLEALSLSARDLPRARAFYSVALGFPVVEEIDGRSFVVDAGGVQLHVDMSGTRSPLADAEPRLSFRTGELGRRCASLRDHGVSVEGPISSPGGAYARLSDPDGHPITLFER
jgi:catechol 2,3-dioxygenase-like lactoylglutathione lyase family enzyme